MDPTGALFIGNSAAVDFVRRTPVTFGLYGHYGL